MGTIGVLGVHIADLVVEGPMHGVQDRHWYPVRHGDHSEPAMVVDEIERPALSASPERAEDSGYVVGFKRR
jgi:hypothetical protein